MSGTMPTRRRGAGRRGGRGFSLIELLVVVAVLAILIGLVVTSTNALRNVAKRGNSIAMLQAIRSGLDQYHSDMGVYPPSYADNAYQSGVWYGSELLAQALVGYRDDDGAQGLGWRVTVPGRVHGPYVDADKLTTGTLEGRNHPVFMDAFNNVFLYYRYDKDPSTADELRYRCTHNAGGADAGPGGSDQNLFRRYATRGSNATTDWYSTTYMLLSRGPNKQWDDPERSGEADDITNIFP